MLQDSRIRKYYMWVQNYWTERLHTAGYNLDQEFAQYCLTLLDGVIASDDTPSNVALLDAEDAARSTYNTALVDQSAGLATQAQVDAALLAFQTAKGARAEAIPNPTALINSINARAEEIHAGATTQHNQENNENSRLLLIAATRITGYADHFAATAQEWITANYVMETEREYAAEQTPSPDALERYGYFSDGQYGREINRVSPEGNFYGSSTMVQELHHYYWWNQTEWKSIPAVLDQAAAPNLLPQDAAYGDIFRVIDIGNPSGWSFYLYNGSSWEKMIQLWDIEGKLNLPQSGYRIGEYHKVIERDVSVYWDGEGWQRQPVGAWGADTGSAAEDLIERLVDLDTRAIEIRSDHNALLSDFLETAESFETSIQAINDLLNNISSDGWVTQAEAQSLRLAWLQLKSESGDILAVAVGLGIATPRTDYLIAINYLEDLITYWFSQPTYPIQITAGDRSAIWAAFEDVEDKKSKLENAINGTSNDNVLSYIDDQIDQVNDALNDLEGSVINLSSDLYITISESNVLKATLGQLQAESLDVIAAAEGLGITTPKTNYVSALAALAVVLSEWIDQGSYPIRITASDRTEMLDALKLVQQNKSQLINSIRAVGDELLTGYVADQIADVDDSINGLAGQWAAFSSPDSLTLSEAMSLKNSLLQVQGEADDIIDVATMLGITTEKAAFSTALGTLASTLSPWIDQTTYPMEISTNQRTAINSAFSATQDAKSVLINKIGWARANGVQINLTAFQGYVDGEFTEVNELYQNINEEVVKLSSDDWLTLAESNALQNTLRQIMIESADLISIATAAGVVAERVAYSEALDGVITAFSAWFDPILLDSVSVSWASNARVTETHFDNNSYPLVVTVEERNAITGAIDYAQASKNILQQAITSKLNVEIVSTVNAYVNAQIAELNSAIGSLSSQLSAAMSDLSISEAEANELELTLSQVCSEADDIIASATALGIVEEKQTFSDAVAALEGILADYIDQASYPIEIDTDDRDSINLAFALVQSSRTTLVNLIRDTQINGIKSDLTDLTDLVSSSVGALTQSVSVLSTLTSKYSSDNYLTRSESNSLKIAMARVVADAADLGTVSNSLHIETERTDFIAAVRGLVSAFNAWLTPIDMASGLYWSDSDVQFNDTHFDTATYPVAVTANQRLAIKTGFESVTAAQAALVVAINAVINNNQSAEFTDYIDTQVSELTDSFGVLQAQFSAFGSNSYITRAEANALKLSKEQLVTESAQFVAMANSLGLTTQATAYSAALSSLQSALSPFVDQSGYPIAITAGQRSAVQAAFNAVQAAKAAVINAITSKKVQDAEDSVGFDISQFRLVYDGFVRGFTPELELIWVGPKELSLRPRYNDFDYLTISEQNIKASKRTSVFVTTPILNWNEETNSLYTSTLQASTEYWVYLANRDDGFELTNYDYRGRLFCSLTAPSNNYLGDEGLGLKAILIGQAETSASKEFLHTLDVSYVSRQSDLAETFREFSDFNLEFVDQNTIRLSRISGTYGQMYIPESLYYLGENRELYRTGPRIELDQDENLIYTTSAIAANTLYYIYIAGGSDTYNFNDLNQTTNRPWHPEDPQIPSGYVQAKDLRLGPFLSTQPPDEGRLSRTYYGFWCRHIGYIRTDANGYFRYAGDLSSIRQPTLNPRYASSIAELTISSSNGEILVSATPGTSGVIFVGGLYVELRQQNDPLVHKITLSTTVYSYTGSHSAPLVSTGQTIADNAGKPLYLYIANNQSCWDGQFAQNLIVSNSPPANGYLSGDWPGNNARWLADFTPDLGATSGELITNGLFDTSSGWSWGTGWTHNSAYLCASKSAGSTATLTQGINGVVSGSLYRVGFSIKARTSGGVTVSMGGTGTGEYYLNNGNYVVSLRASNTGGVTFTPDVAFAGFIDDVSVQRVLSAGLSIQSLTNTLEVAVPRLNDRITSSATLWSSEKVATEINLLRSELGAYSGEDAVIYNGVPLVLSRVSNTELSLSPIVPNLSLALRDGNRITVPGSIPVTLSGAPGFYYVYIGNNGVFLSATAPDVTVGRAKSLGYSWLVGYVYLTGPGLIQGDYNVCSFNHETKKQWVVEFSDSYTISASSNTQYTRFVGSSSAVCPYLTVGDGMKIVLFRSGVTVASADGETRAVARTKVDPQEGRYMVVGSDYWGTTTVEWMINIFCEYVYGQGFATQETELYTGAYDDIRIKCNAMGYKRQGSNFSSYSLKIAHASQTLKLTRMREE